MTTFIQIALILIFAVGLTACPGNRSLQSKSGASVKTVKGDPDVFVKGTLTNGLRALPSAISEVPEWDFDISGWKEEPAVTDVQEVVQKQSPSATAEQMNVSYVLKSFAQNETLVIRGRFKNESVAFTFGRASTGWVPTNFEFLGVTPAQIIHTSVKNDGSAFSLLIQDKTPGRRKVYSLIFQKVKPIRTRLGEKIYEYLFGPGIKVGWNKQKPVVVTVCGQLPSPLSTLVQEENEKWARALNGQPPLVTEFKKACPPFSDLNTHTLSFVQDWIEIVGEPGVAAQTVPIASAGREEIADADIVFLMQEFQEALALKNIKASVMSPEVLALPGFRAELRKTTLHEMGHFLGLHHQFSPQITSIMSYSEKLDPKLYDYDLKAIQTLYAE